MAASAICKVERALRFLDRAHRDAVDINHRRLEACVAELRLDGADIVAGLEEVGRVGMAKGVSGYPLVNGRLAYCYVQGLL